MSMRMERGQWVAQLQDTATGRKAVGLFVSDQDSGRVAETEIAAPNLVRALATHLHRLADKLEGRG